MSNEGLARLSKLVQLYSSAVADLERLREQVGHKPELLPIFEPSALYAVDAVKREIQNTLEEIHPDTDEADVWIHLEGPALASGHVPISLLGRYLKGLSIANRHAVSIIKREQHTATRFTKGITDVAEFSLVKTAPGSIRIGLVKPDVSGFAPALPRDYQASLFPEVLVESWHQAEEESRTAVKGLRLLISAVEASQDDQKLRRLREYVGQENTVRLLHHARVLAPSPRDPINTVGIYGISLERTPESPVRLTVETREALRLCAESLLDDRRMVEAHGRIRAVDIDRRTITARPLYFDDSDEYFDDIECKLTDDIDIDENHIKAILNRPVAMSGMTVLSETGEIKSIEVLDVEYDCT